jgi:O-Antigen ligase
MNNAPAALRSLLIYAVCVPLAIIIGYLLKDPLTYSTLAILGMVGFVLAFPIVVRWHYPLLLLSWGMPCILLFIKGQPNVWLALGLLTLGISILERALSRESRFIYVPQVVWPLACLIGVVLVTAKLTGGFGLRSMGSDVYGGKKYIFLLVGIVSYFALTTRRIPADRAKLYVGLFFLGGLTCVIGDLYIVSPSWLEFVFWFFPPTAVQYTAGGIELGVTRLGGVGGAGMAIYSYMMVRYGIRGILLSGSLLRPVFFVLASVVIFLGGFRSALMFAGLMFILQFFLEGLHRTKLMPVLALTGLLGCALMVPLAPKLPFTFQRSLAFVPGLELDPDARLDAEGSSEWRKQMWTALLPQVSQYFFIGKGYAISMADYQMMGLDSPFLHGTKDPTQQGLALSGDYHNGPLSVAIPFGIWGVITFFWFTFAGLRVMYRNYRYGDPSLRIINTFLFVYYAISLLMFIFVVGSMSSDIARFIGMLGLSVALNGGMRRAPKALPAEATSDQPNLLLQSRPSFQR